MPLRGDRRRFPLNNQILFDSMNDLIIPFIRLREAQAGCYEREAYALPPSMDKQRLEYLRKAAYFRALPEQFGLPCGTIKF